MEGLEIAIVSSRDLERTLRIDAEYFQKYFIVSQKLIDQTRRENVADLTAISDGNHFTISDDFVDRGIPYYRGQDVVGNFFIEHSSSNFITEEAFSRAHMMRSHLQRGDVLLSIIGTIGELSLVGSGEPATCSCKLAILRPHSIAPEYLAVFLHSIYGRRQIERLTRGAVQRGLLLEDMDLLWVCRFSDAFENAIAAAVHSAKEHFTEADRSQKAAEEALLGAIGLADWMPPEPLTYTRPAADVLAAGRFDAQYFMPAKQQVQKALAAMPGLPLGQRFHSVRDLFDPKSAPADTMVRNYDVTDALMPVLDDEKEPSKVEDILSVKKRFQYDDVAISRLRAYLRQIAVVRASSNIPAVGSSEFIVLRPVESSTASMASETLMTFLRSAPVQTVLKWCQDGSQHPRFSERDLLSIHVPDAVALASPEIEAIVQESFAARRRARDLLCRARCAVEIAIEGSEDIAMRFLDEAEP